MFNLASNDTASTAHKTTYWQPKHDGLPARGMPLGGRRSFVELNILSTGDAERLSQTSEAL